MKKFKIKTPSDQFAGVRHGVRFYKGEAEAELTEAVVAEMLSWGYELEEVKEAKKPAPKKPAPQTKSEK